MAKDRAREDKRSVGSHEKIMGALGKAAGWKSTPLITNNSKVTNIATHSTEGGQPSRPVKRMHQKFIPGKGNIKATNVNSDLTQGTKGVSKDLKASDIPPMTRIEL